MPTATPEPKMEISVSQRMLDFVEHPLFITPVAAVGGLVGMFIYTPVLAVTGICILLAFHRVKVVIGLPKSKQFVAYAILFIVVFASLYGVGYAIKINIPQIATPEAIAVQILKLLPSSTPQMTPQIAPSSSPSPTLTLKDVHPFVVDIENSMVQTNPGFTMNRFYVGYRSVLGDTLSPVDISMFVRFVNLQPFPSTIQKFYVDVAFDGKKWQPLFNIPISGNRVFWIGVPDGAEKCREIGTDNALDIMLQDRAIQPHEPIRGWLYLTIPRDYSVPSDLRQTKYRITAFDAADTKFVYTFSPPKPEHNGGSLSQTIGIHVLSGYRNVEKFQQKYYHELIR